MLSEFQIEIMVRELFSWRGMCSTTGENMDLSKIILVFSELFGLYYFFYFTFILFTMFIDTPSLLVQFNGSTLLGSNVGAPWICPSFLGFIF